MMGLRDKLERLRKDYDKGKSLYLQDKMKRSKSKMEKAKQLKPGTIRYGLMVKQSPISFMKDAYDRRRYNRLRKEAERKDKEDTSSKS